MYAYVPDLFEHIYRFNDIPDDKTLNDLKFDPVRRAFSTLKQLFGKRKELWILQLFCRNIDGYSATFQGIGEGYSMLIGSSLIGEDVLKHWGLNIIQTTAAVEGTKRSFMFEIWNGSAWVEFNVMALDIFNYYKWRL